MIEPNFFEPTPRHAGRLRQASLLITMVRAANNPLIQEMRH